MKNKLNIAVVFILFLFICYSCSDKNQTYLNKDLSCSDSEYNEKDLEEVMDIHKNFILKSPKTWKTNLYYNDYESEIFTADTTKDLTKTFIYDVSMINGDLKMDKDSESLVINNYLQQENLKLVSNGNGKFLDRDSFWFLAEGTKRNYKFSNYILFVRNSEKKYLKVNAELFGEDNIDERICNIVELTNKIKILSNY
ncbi:hypothetical protein [Aureivirga sp. CE67]|uniref:hypothetical protein n=1 Tax=Aureivirga sp. CE67 TaxID=1788983 RepID=UPI0018C9D49F|nr:hypothetical protein [Aureivirga sp. CE67]